MQIFKIHERGFRGFWICYYTKNCASNDTKIVFIQIFSGEKRLAAILCGKELNCGFVVVSVISGGVVLVKTSLHLRVQIFICV